MIPTAEEFLDNFLNKDAIPWSPEIDKVYGCINTAMTEFAKLKVEGYKKEIIEKIIQEQKNLNLGGIQTEDIKKFGEHNAYKRILMHIIEK